MPVLVTSGRCPWLVNLIVAGMAIGWALDCGNPLLWSQETRWVDPAAFGLAIAPGPLLPGNDRSVITHDESGKPVVGKLYAQIGATGVILLPDGQLVGRTSKERVETERKFVPATLEQLASELPTGSLDSFRTKKTRHYVYVYNTSEHFALATSRILESMLKGMVAHARTQQIETSQPAVPLVAIMFRSKEEFQAYRRMPDGVVAYYHTLTNRVVMHEESELANFKPELALQQTISTIAHEGAHQILHNIGVQSRLSAWPLWLSEGLAEYYAPTSVGRRLSWKGAGHVNDLRMFELEMYLKGRETALMDGPIIEQTIKAGRLTSTGYASAWALTHCLAKTRRKEFNRYIKDVSQLGPFEAIGKMVSPGVVPENLDHFANHFGPDLPALEERVLRHIQKLPYRDPFAEWPHFVATVSIVDGNRAERDANLFHTRSLAQKWLSERRSTLPPIRREGLQSQIRSFPNRPQAERFVREWLGRTR